MVAEGRRERNSSLFKRSNESLDGFLNVFRALASPEK